MLNSSKSSEDSREVKIMLSTDNEVNHEGMKL